MSLAVPFLTLKRLERLSMTLYGKRERAFHFANFSLNSKINIS